MAQERYEREPYRGDWEDERYRDRERNYGRGREDWRGESREYRSGREYGGEFGRGESRYGRGRQNHDYRQERDYEGTLRAGNDYGWRDEDRYQEEPSRSRSGGDYGPRDSGGGGYGAQSYGGDYGRREYGADWERSGRSRSYGGSGGGYGYGGYSGYGSRGSSDYTGPFKRDYSHDYQSRNWSGGTSGGYGQQSYGRRGDRDWWDRAGDEVASWFGDDDAQRRREMDRRRGRGPKNYTRSDERIREDVCDRLTDDPLIDASEIDVRVQNQEVTLSGTADSRNERRLAEECAESVSGVKHVQNNIRVQERGTSQSGQSATTGAASTGQKAGSTTTM